MSNKLRALKDLDDLLCKYEVKDLEDLENRLKNVAESEEYIEMLLEDKSVNTDLVSLYAKKCKNYEQQLAEKELILDKILTEIHTNCYSGLNIVKFKEMVLNDLGSVVIKHNQDKISFAVEQFEKVKELAHNRIKEIANDLSEEGDERLNQKHTIHGLATAITDIDNQIEELKKEMK